jgi:hypothetical protein
MLRRMGDSYFRRCDECLEKYLNSPDDASHPSPDRVLDCSRVRDTFGGCRMTFSDVGSVEEPPIRMARKERAVGSSADHRLFAHMGSERFLFGLAGGIHFYPTIRAMAIE